MQIIFTILNIFKNNLLFFISCGFTDRSIYSRKNSTCKIIETKQIPIINQKHDIENKLNVKQESVKQIPIINQKPDIENILNVKQKIENSLDDDYEYGFYYDIETGKGITPIFI